MITPQEYIENKYPIIPCYKNERRPKGDEWEEKEIIRNIFFVDMLFFKDCFILVASRS